MLFRLFKSLCNLMIKTCAKTIAISLTFFFIVMVTPLIFFIATDVIISGKRGRIIRA